MVRFIKPGLEVKKVKKTSAARASGRKTPQGDNGLASFAMHATDAKGKKTLAKLAAAPPIATAAAVAPNLTTLDPETAARHHLDVALASKTVKSFNRPTIGSADSEFRTLNSETVPLAGTTVVKFRQTFNKIPVYGSLVTVELDGSNACLGINSSLGTPTGVNHIAKVSPAGALQVAAKASGTPVAKIKATPRLHYYYDQEESKWRLAYIIEDVPQAKRKVLADGRSDAARKDYVVDAHSGKLLAGLPRTPSMAAVQESAIDGLKNKRKIIVEKAGAKRHLRNKALNVSTYTFGYKDPTAKSHLLPGTIGSLPPKPWAVESVSAHANAEDVARYLREVLKRNNIDGSGGEMISTVNCWDRSEGTTPAKEWKNAYWNGDQMVYGQVKFPDGSFFSIASMADVVAHEMFHGITDFTSRLEYQGQSGALNESYSDIFGVIIANRGKDLSTWNWRIGEGFDGPGSALRDMSDPTKHGQPKLMKNFITAGPPYTINNDYGEVHANSGIHNYAAYRIMNAQNGGQQTFTADEVAAMFFIALTVHLSRSSQFADSRRAVLQAARSLFRNDAPDVLSAKLQAVERGFTAAGIQ